jgi:hypothetical protein
MVDYSVDESFDIHFTKLQDFATVSGRDEFEEDVMIDIHFKLAELTGTHKNKENLEEKIKLQVSRTAKKYNAIDNIEEIYIERLFRKPDTISVEIVYETGEVFQESI